MSNEDKIDMLEKEIFSMKEELSTLRELQKVDREVLDANVVSIYNHMVKKHIATILCFSFIVSCVLLVASQIIANLL